MDNLCHTLVGAALAEAGLRKKTPLATATLLIGVNVADVDGILYWLNRPVEALGFRRGWTHGVLADAVWPFVLAGLMLAWDRWVRRRGHLDRPPADPRALVWLALLAVLTHPLLDLCNTYGVRLLMPFSGHWFHGDTLFIIARKGTGGAGPPFAVKRVTGPHFPLAYRLGPADVMMAGMAFEGDVHLSVRLSKNGVAGPGESGDLEGEYPGQVPVGTRGVDIVIARLR